MATDETPVTIMEIADNCKKTYRLEVFEYEDTWFFKLFDGRAIVGRANCIIADKTVLIGDLNVFSEARIPDGFIARCLRPVFNFKPRTRNYQRRGLGTKLLQAVIHHSRSKNFTSITGFLSQLDKTENPGLIRWYQKMGFEVVDDGQAIVMILSDIHAE